MKFKPEDFIDMDWENGLAVREAATRVANAKVDSIVEAEVNRRLQEWLDAAPRVYGNEAELDWTMKPLPAGIYVTHTARLVEIEEINK